MSVNEILKKVYCCGWWDSIKAQAKDSNPLSLVKNNFREAKLALHAEVMKVVNSVDTVTPAGEYIKSQVKANLEEMFK